MQTVATAASFSSLNQSITSVRFRYYSKCLNSKDRKYFQPSTANKYKMSTDSYQQKLVILHVLLTVAIMCVTYAPPLNQ